MKPEDLRSGRSSDPAPDGTVAHPADAGDLWEQFLSRGNLAEALRRVEQNAGAPGIDGMSTKDLRLWLHSRWTEVRSALEAGTYRPQPVRRVMIPKPSGGKRKLGVPAAVDRMICQAIAQVLTPIFDPQFHPHSFGFRPGRSQHQAVERARQFISDGAVWCVDFDLESFFDRVQHDALMARIARRVHDKRLLKLIRRYLEAGVMEGGLVHATTREPRRGLRSRRCSATSCSTTSTGSWSGAGTTSSATPTMGAIYVHSRRAGERVMASITHYVEERLKLRVNREKSVVARALRRPFLGFCLRPRMGEVRVLVDPKALRRAKDRLRGSPRGAGASRWSGGSRRSTASRSDGRPTSGWPTPRPYSRTSTNGSDAGCGKCDGRNGSAPARGGATCERSVSPKRTPANGRARARGTGASLAPNPSPSRCPTATGPHLGLQGFSDPYRRFRDAKRTAGCGPARPVVWGAPG